MINTDTASYSVRPTRRWLSVEQPAQEFPAFTSPAIRALIQRSRPHYNHHGEFSRWLERWVTDQVMPGALGRAA